MRKKYESALKARVAIEAIKGARTTAGIAKEFEVPSSLVSLWNLRYSTMTRELNTPARNPPQFFWPGKSGSQWMAGAGPTITSSSKDSGILKYEEVYLSDYDNVTEADNGIRRWFMFYNHERPHQSLGCRTPWDIYVQRVKRT